MKPEDGLFGAQFESPVGWLVAVSDGNGLLDIHFSDEPETGWTADALSKEAVSQLQRYFEGDLKEFDLPLAPVGTAFQQEVWNELQRIPFSQTRSYLDIAKAVGGVEKTRAVGLANGKNPLAIVVPCHRVIGANGHLTGYAGGLWRKRWLLDHESTGHLFAR